MPNQDNVRNQSRRFRFFKATNEQVKQQINKRYIEKNDAQKVGPSFFVSLVGLTTGILAPVIPAAINGVSQFLFCFPNMIINRMTPMLFDIGILAASSSNLQAIIDGCQNPNNIFSKEVTEMISRYSIGILAITTIAAVGINLYLRSMLSSRANNLSASEQQSALATISLPELKKFMATVNNKLPTNEQLTREQIDNIAEEYLAWLKDLFAAAPTSAINYTR